VKPIRTILVAVDFSASSDAALDMAIELARPLGAEVHVVHAYELRVPMVMPYEVSLPQTFMDDTRNAAATKLAGDVAKIERAGITAHSHLDDTSAVSAVAKTAESVNADLIIMGTRGHTGLKHILLGSVAERTLRIAPCSVLTVKVADPLAKK
jgi:nucleotide-binding universal stress UspA family protein